MFKRIAVITVNGSQKSHDIGSLNSHTCHTSVEAHSMYKNIGAEKGDRDKYVS